MSRPYPDALALSRKVLRALIILNLVAGFLILALLIASLVAEGPVMRGLGVRPTVGSGTLIIGMRLIMVIGICAVPIANIVLTRLKAIVDTVTLGDPFVAQNAARLQTIAWAVLALELLHLVVGAVARISSSEANPLHLDWNLSVTRWLAVLLCFVLARVFERGTQMREDLEGTV
jgi:Protein of unknown function (DUF2975)